MSLSKNDKNTFFLVIIIIVFIVILIIWRILTAYFPSHFKVSEQNDIFSEVIDQAGDITGEIKKETGQLINQSELNQEQIAPDSSAQELTNLQVEEIENKILEHLNQAKQ
jgi:hypothetical protein